MVHTTDDLDGFQYFNGVLQFFPHAEGYVKQTTVNNQMTFDYVFNYTDHLGNIRLSYAKDPQTGDLKIMDENHYYPFGLKHKKYAVVPKTILSNENQTDKALLDVDPSNPVLNIFSNYDYKMNGKEWQDEHGLNIYDMDMRQYDPAIARWVVMDPVVHHSMSPYNAFDNNPIFWADPSGMDSWSYDWDTNNGTYVNNDTGERSQDHERAKNETISDVGIKSAVFIVAGADFANNGGKTVTETGQWLYDNIKADYISVGSYDYLGSDIQQLLHYDNMVRSYYNSGADIYLYGYSRGGQFVMDLARFTNVTIQLMVTVDAANGWWSHKSGMGVKGVNREISDNVLLNYNYYQTTENSILKGRTPSSGAPNFRGLFSSHSTSPPFNGGIYNFNVTSELYNGSNVDHVNIDEHTRGRAANIINATIGLKLFSN